MKYITQYKKTLFVPKMTPSEGHQMQNQKKVKIWKSDKSGINILHQSYEKEEENLDTQTTNEKSLYYAFLYSMG